MIHGLAHEPVDFVQSLDARGPVSVQTRGSGLHESREVAAPDTQDAVRLDPDFRKQPRQCRASRVRRDKSLRIGARTEDVGIVPVVG